MGVTVLAAGDAIGAAARLAFDLGVPLIGLTCLLIGLWERRRSRARTPVYPYPPGPPPMRYPGPPPTAYPDPYPGPPRPGYPPYPGYPPDPR
jgi:hypothetical protein